MTDREWWDSLPAGTEFLTPPGECGGLFRADNKGGLRCRPDIPDADDLPSPGSGYRFIEFWASGADWVPLSVLRTWEIYTGE